MSSYHLGCYDGGLPVDQDGYTHATIREWLTAPMDWGPLRGEARWDWARTAAARARKALDLAEAEVAAWRTEDTRA